jgi:uncharacterized protein DUF6882
MVFGRLLRVSVPWLRAVLPTSDTGSRRSDHQGVRSHSPRSLSLQPTSPHPAYAKRSRGCRTCVSANWRVESVEWGASLPQPGRLGSCTCVAMAVRPSSDASGRLLCLGWLKRNGRSDGSGPEVEPGDLGTLLLQGEEMVEQLAQAHMSWGLGSADRWGLDQRTGTITWTFPDKTATAPAQIIGSYSPSAKSWVWAWANESILPEMSRDSLALREWGEAHGQSAFRQPRIDNVDESMAGSLCALALRINAGNRLLPRYRKRIDPDHHLRRDHSG